MGTYEKKDQLNKIHGGKIMKKTNFPSLIEIKQIKKAISIKFEEFVFDKQKQKDFPSILTRKQKEAIKNIEEYWTNRITNYRNWKRQKHFSYKFEENEQRRI